KTFSITINALPTIGNLSFGQWTMGKSGFTGTMAIINGTVPHAITAQSGLPTGLTAIVSGATIKFTGTPTVVGVFHGSVTIKDLAGAAATKTFQITINPALTFAPAALPGYTINQAYSQTITTAGGTGARVVTYTLSGPIPSGLSITPS